ncbi:MAG: right-handed parallel beta-helix repeat-containing protein [Armatimonadetes bacterium]|nr:right-handed parallel beta-helix repeat-containing protein [Armatimonadota bacterium]
MLMVLVSASLGLARLLAGPSQTPVEYYVSPQGDDSWSGKLNSPNAAKTDGPFRTVERARRTIAEIDIRTRGKEIVVWLREGEHRLTDTLRFVGPGWGSATAPVRFEAYRSEKPTINGSLPVAVWKPVSDPATLKRISPLAKGQVFVADLKAQGITDFGSLKRRGFGVPVRPAPLELTFKGQPMELARWPNKGQWTHIADVPAGPQGGKFSFEGVRPARWEASDDIWVHGYWTWDWADSQEHVISLDALTREVRTEEPHGVYGYKKGARYFFLNVFEELDSPGEYFVDRENGLLYFWPPAPLAEGSCEVSMLEKPLVDVKGASHVAFRGITFEGGRAGGITVQGGTGIIVEGCTFRDFGNSAVSVSGTSCRVSSCDIYDVGECGIELSGGDRKTLQPGNNVVENNHIFRCQRTCYTYYPGIRLDGVGNTISHNLIEDLPHSAILGGGNDHLIEGNEIARVCMETHDAGAYYMGRDWTHRGNRVIGNYFHDLGRGDVNAVYLDDWLSGTLVQGNVFYRAGRGVMIGGGRDNTVRENLFIDCSPAIHVDARGKGWASSYFDGKDNTLFDRLRAMNGTQGLYAERYPPLKTILQDDPAWPKGNAIENNIRFGGRWLDLLDNVKEKDLVLSGNASDGDPGFVNPAKGDYRIRANSPFASLMASVVQREKPGLKLDRYRKMLPERKGPLFGLAK